MMSARTPISLPQDSRVHVAATESSTPILDSESEDEGHSVPQMTAELSIQAKQAGRVVDQTRMSLRAHEQEMRSEARRRAVLGGLQCVTGGSCQGLVHFVLNLLSAFLILAQLVSNLWIEWSAHSETGCKKAGVSRPSTTLLWIWAQTILNSLATLGQIGVWVMTTYQSILFRWNWGTFPNAKFASFSDPQHAYRQIRLEEISIELNEGTSFKDLDTEDQHALRQDHLDDIDEEYVQDKYEFMKDVRTLSRVNSFQESLTAFRAIIGAVGAIVEPSLMATNTLSNPGFKGGGVAELFQKAFRGATTAPPTSAITTTTTTITKDYKAIAECGANRQFSSAASGVIAAVGLWQTNLKAKYARLVLLDQQRDKKIHELKKAQIQTGRPDAVAAQSRSLERFEQAVEREVMDIVGPQGKKAILLMGGGDD